VLVAADTAAAAIRSNFRIGQEQLVGSVGALTERVHGPGYGDCRCRAAVRGHASSVDRWC
jgi:hypothetical protein